MTGRPEDWLVRQLPQGMLAEDFFVRFVSIFQEEAGTLLAHADNLPYLAEIGLTPTAMIRQMAHWLGLPGIDASFSPEAQRRILRTAAATLQWRGTRAGLERLLELYSGAPARIREGGGVFREGEAPDGRAWVVLEVDSTGPLGEADFLTLVLDEVPAAVRTEVRVGGRQIWPALPAEGTIAS